MPLQHLLQRFWPPNPAELDALRAFRDQVRDPIGRFRRLHQDWLALTEVAAEDERVANTASVNRWETFCLLRQLEQTITAPPRRGTAAFHQLRSALVDAVRAWQLLATGYRFHSFDALCDGQTLLLEAARAIDAVERQVEDATDQARGSDV